jgi:hypothetical protein
MDRAEIGRISRPLGECPAAQFLDCSRDVRLHVKLTGNAHCYRVLSSSISSLTPLVWEVSPLDPALQLNSRFEIPSRRVTGKSSYFDVVCADLLGPTLRASNPVFAIVRKAGQGADRRPRGLPHKRLLKLKDLEQCSWRTHFCVPRRHSCRRLAGTASSQDARDFCPFLHTPSVWVLIAASRTFTRRTDGYS